MSAKAGFDVVLKDIKPEALDGARACAAQIAGLKHLTDDERAAIAAGTYTVDNEPIRGSDLIIEAVVENLGIKHAVNRELEPLLAQAVSGPATPARFPSAFCRSRRSKGPFHRPAFLAG